MSVFLIVIAVLLSVFLLISFGMVAYLTYQLRRNDAVYKIRKNWIETDDSRLHKYSYEYMFDPSRVNWFGFKYPKDTHFR